MRKRLALVIVILMGLGWYHFRAQEPDLTTWDGIVERSAELSERLTHICNVKMNEFSDVECHMSVRNWTLDLNYRRAGPFADRWDTIVDLFCTMSTLAGREPTITVNGQMRHCGGMEV